MRLGAPVPPAAGRLRRAGQRRAEHDRVGAARDGLDQVARAAHAAVGDDVHVPAAGLVEVVAAGGGDVRDRGRHRRVDAQRDARRVRRAAAEADEHARRARAHEVQRRGVGRRPPTITGTSSS